MLNLLTPYVSLAVCAPRLGLQDYMYVCRYFRLNFFFFSPRPVIFRETYDIIGTAKWDIETSVQKGGCSNIHSSTILS